MNIRFERIAALITLLSLFVPTGGCSSAESEMGGASASGASAGASTAGGAQSAGGGGSSSGGTQAAAGSSGALGVSGAAGGGVAGEQTMGGGGTGGVSGQPAESGGMAGSLLGGAGSNAAAGSSGSVGSAGTGGALPKLTVWIAGDSTVASGGPCPIGWGGQIKALFRSQVAVNNSAVGGRSVRTWLYDVQATKDSAGECNLGKDAQGNPTVQARWTAMLAGMKAGDYLFVQFGINDGDSTCPRHVGATAFKTSYGMLAQAAKDRGAHPVFVTPVSQIACAGNNVSASTREPYVTATKDAGTQYGVPVIDLNALSRALYQKLGFCPIPGGDVSANTTGPVGAFFCDDHTHFDQAGAVQIASLIATALKAQNIGLAEYLQ